MKQSVYRALVSLSNTSEEAQKLVETMGDNPETGKLKKLLSQLSCELAVLRGNEDPAILGADEADRLSVSFMERLRLGENFSQYTRAWFIQQPKAARCVLAKCLIRVAEERGLEVNPLWYDVYSNAGEM